jgi:3D (Asp-Asp-Asp) domain-containing protein
MTFYWIAAEETERAEKVLFDLNCREMARVSKAFARRLAMEGTGRLRDGRTINAVGKCRCARACYMWAPEEARWGMGVNKQTLTPFRSVAVDRRVIEIGSWLYIPALDGLTMPGDSPWGKFVHDGCVVAADVGANVRGHRLDLFAVRKEFYHQLSREHRLHRVSVHDGANRCAANALQESNGVDPKTKGSNRRIAWTPAPASLKLSQTIKAQSSPERPFRPAKRSSGL